MKKISKVIEVYVCDVCGEEFPDEEWCSKHEETCAQLTEESKQRVERAFQASKDRFAQDKVLLFLIGGGYEDDARAIMQNRVWSEERNESLGYDEDSTLVEMMFEYLRGLVAK